jgi:hypothetical protein
MHRPIICFRRIWDSHSGGYEKYYLLGYNAVYSVESKPTFRRKINPPSSGIRISRARNQLATCFRAGSLLGLFFDCEDGGDMFFRNVGLLST